ELPQLGRFTLRDEGRTIAIGKWNSTIIKSMSQRARVVSVYKQLYHLGKEYPKGADWFHTRLKAAFLKNK
ncbi:hypothetical protein COOONC_24460, partial [Cooperia oncophora]